ncbi:hypothetical protein CABS01_09995 [Colletotrichum abscissum]|uniref:uncharacterized protein n=1 Tax=Colletotrichum abscissum TaxID=1671311 RepID=UPI0027D735F6|nr:uncharacterized protein CABS01_09995 [Colletotrichum abscissum]KAK1500271.1 hypothetical protein CABS01_09995 [Colletotrichum abscissum]
MLDAGHAASLTASQIVQSFNIQPYSAAGCPVRRQTYVQSPRRAVNGVFEASRPVLDTRPFAMDPNNGKANGPVRDGPPVRARECPPVQG